MADRITVLLLVLLVCALSWACARPRQNEPQSTGSTRHPSANESGSSPSQPGEPADGAALEFLRQIVVVEEAFKSTNGRSATIGELMQSNAISFPQPGPPHVRDGYLFYDSPQRDGYQIIAMPTDRLGSGNSSHSIFVATTAGIQALNVEEWRTYSTMHANEYNAITTMRSLNIAELSFAKKWALRYGSLADLRQENLLDPKLNPESNDGYQFAIELSADRKQFRLLATPIRYGITGVKSFCSSNDCVVHGADKQGAAASNSDLPVY